MFHTLRHFLSVARSKVRVRASALKCQFDQRLIRYASHPNVWYSDWSLRYLPIIDQLDGRLSNASVLLELGSNKFGLSMFVPHPVIGVDLVFDSKDLLPDRLYPLKASAANLPILTGHCDHIVCVDMFEHLPVFERLQVLREILRALKRGGRAIIAFPCGEKSREHDESLWKSLQSRQQDLDWLDEHMKYPYPMAEEFLRLFAQASEGSGEYRVHKRKNTSLFLERLYIPLLIDARNYGLNLYCRAIFKAAIPCLRYLNVGDCYRQIFVIDRS